MKQVNNKEFVDEQVEDDENEIFVLILVNVFLFSSILVIGCYYIK